MVPQGTAASPLLKKKPLERKVQGRFGRCLGWKALSQPAHLFSLDSVPIVGLGMGRLVQPGRTQSWDEGPDVQKHEGEEGGVSNSRRQESGTENADLMNMAADSPPLSL